MDPRLTALARARGGIVTVAEAGRLSVTPAALNRLVRSGEMVHLRRGAYAVASAWAEGTEQERYALRTRAVLRTREGVAASHYGALLLAGVPVDRLPEDMVRVCDTTGAHQRVRTKAGLSVHPRPAGSRLHIDAEGDSYLDVAHALVLVARDDSPVAAAVALDQALRIRATSMVGVQEVLATHDRRSRWVRQLGVLLADCDPLSPGPTATRLRILLTDLGFRPRLRVPLRDINGQYLVRPELLIGTSVAVVRDAYPPEIRDRLTQVGVVVASVSDSDVDHPDRVAAAIARALHTLTGMRVRARAS